MFGVSINSSRFAIGRTFEYLELNRHTWWQIIESCDRMKDFAHRRCLFTFEILPICFGITPTTRLQTPHKVTIATAMAYQSALPDEFNIRILQDAGSRPDGPNLQQIEKHIKLLVRNLAESYVRLDEDTYSHDYIKYRAERAVWLVHCKCFRSIYCSSQFTSNSL